MTVLLTPFRATSAARLSLVCFPFAGGSSVWYRDWADELWPEIEVVAVELPGRGRLLAEEPIHDMALFLDQAVPAMRVLDAPRMAFFGHSMGAALAYEAAVQLARSGIEVDELVVSGRGILSSPRSSSLSGDMSREQLVEVLRQFQGTPEQILQDPELLDLILPVVRADFDLISRYEPAEVVLSCPIQALYAADDHQVDSRTVARWATRTNSSFSLHRISGGHFSVFDESRSAVLEVLRHLLPHDSSVSTS